MQLWKCKVQPGQRGEIFRDAMDTLSSSGLARGAALGGFWAALGSFGAVFGQAQPWLGRACRAAASKGCLCSRGFSAFGG